MLRFEVTLQKPYENFYDEFTINNDASSLDAYEKALEIAKELMLDCIDWNYSLDEPDEDGDYSAVVYVEYPNIALYPNIAFDENSKMNYFAHNGDCFFVEKGTPIDKVEKEAEEIAAEIMLSDIEWSYKLIDNDAED